MVEKSDDLQMYMSSVTDPYQPVELKKNDSSRLLK